ncbi:MAG: LysM peptidoglycan-binding domain-containing protein [Chloroflexi bacterium]|nr:LysM peptidoglycan-binding domain-containing protein [Chloroflexota bacterium]MYF82198.1 LysM peptidoglycan-binding domain-containing protein [Chloroflexota bacterium]MYI04840.1 LysM peptidoglycan-binding domain-containing protein [Chloroflexota bacterium]
MSPLAFLHRLPFAIGIPIVLLSLACNSDGSTATPTDPTAVSQSSVVNEDIPVEALPDPLPPPYLIEDDVTVEQAPITETTYVVQPSDTLAAIAARFCITVAEIQRLNTIVDIDSLDIGDELRIPIREGGCGAAAPESAESEETAEAEPARPPGEIYIVEAGDTLADIGFAFGYTWVELMNYNGLTESQAANLQIGQALIIPPQPEQTAPAEDEGAQADQPESSEPPG